MSTAPTAGTIEDPAELLYLHKRKQVRRPQLAAILVSLGLVLGYLAWKVGSHLIAASWLETNQYRAHLRIDRNNWKQGGTTMVWYSGAPDKGGIMGPIHVLKFLKNLHHLEELDLSTLTNLHDADLVNIDKLTDLERLNLDRSRQSEWTKSETPTLTDATLARIGRLSRLRKLNLGAQKITDEGLKNLAGLDKLETLELVETEITDAGLEYLKSLPGLKLVDLTRTRVTPRGVRNFEASRPGVVVMADPAPPAARLATSPAY